MTKNSHMRKIEQTESEELLTQGKRIQLDYTVAKIRKEYTIFTMIHFWFSEMYAILRHEFEQNQVRNLIGVKMGIKKLWLWSKSPVNKEMRNLILSLQTPQRSAQATQFNWGQTGLFGWI